MPVEVVWSKRAREALLDLYVAIGRDNSVAADRIERRARQLADQPRMGSRRPDIRPTVRMLVETPYLILYETVPDADDAAVSRVESVTIVDGRRDLGTIPV